MSALKNDSISTILVSRVAVVEKVCLDYYKEMHLYGGIWFGNNPLHYIFPILLLQIILFFLVSNAVYFILRPLRQPKFVCNILGGIILGPSVLGRNKAFMDILFPPKEIILLNTLSTLGGFYFVFIVSVKMDTALISKMSRNALGIGLSCMVIPFTMTCILCFLLQKHIPGISERPVLVALSFSLSETFFTAIAPAINEINLLTSEMGQLSLSCAMTNEMVVMCSTLLGIFAVRKHQYNVFVVLLAMVAWSVLAVYVVRPTVLWIVKNTPEGKPVNELYVIAILIGALVMGLLCEILGGFFLGGIMLMGLFIPDGPPLGATLVEKSELMIMEFFLPLFYVSAGYQLDVFLIHDWKAFATLQLIVLVGCLGKIIGTCLACLFFNIRLRNALILSLILNIKGVLETFIYLRWKNRKFLDESSYTSLVLSNVAITAIVMPLLEIFYKPHVRLDMPSSFSRRIRSLQLTGRAEELRILSCIHDEDNVRSIITLFEALNSTQVSHIGAYMIQLVELVGKAASVLVPYNNLERGFESSSMDRIMRACTKYSKASRGPITFQFFTLIAPYKSMHESICRLAQDRFVHLIIIPFQKYQENDGTNAKVRQFNAHIQVYTSCTVGILVDRGLHYRFSFTDFSYSVALLFLGGADDREALSFSTRMSSHPDVSITLVRIDFSENHTEENENDRLLDEMLVREFKEMNINNACVVCHEVVADTSIQVLDAIRSIGNNFDLVIVGRRRGANVLFEKEMENWTEYQELGVIGDLIASPEFCGGMMSLLVMQHCGELNAFTGSMKSSESGKSFLYCNL